MRCNVWRQYAENVAESLQRGMRVVVSGRLKQRSYETKEGEKRQVMELEVDDVGPALKYATAKVTKVSRTGGGYGGQRAVPTTPGPQRPRRPRRATLAATPAVATGARRRPAPSRRSAGGAPQYDEPPF